MRLLTKLATAAPATVLAGLTFATPAKADRGVISAIHIGNFNQCVSFLLTLDDASIQGYSIQLNGTPPQNMLALAQLSLVTANIGKTVGLTPIAGDSPCGALGGPIFRRLNMPPATDQ